VVGDVSGDVTLTCVSFTFTSTSTSTTSTSTYVHVHVHAVDVDLDEGSETPSHARASGFFPSFTSFWLCTCSAASGST
jgi:hypothetical protein